MAGGVPYFDFSFIFLKKIEVTFDWSASLESRRSRVVRAARLRCRKSP